MLWKTHIRISFEALRRIGVSLSGQESSRFKDGVLAPDKWKDYPHHYGKGEAIRKNLMYSRKCFLEDDLLNAYFHLGVALHYIQDAHTTLNSRSDKHTSWEEQIEDADYVHDIERLINHVFRNDESKRKKWLSLSKFFSIDVQGRDSTLYVASLFGQEEHKVWARPIVDLNMGLRASFVVSKSVLSSKTNHNLDASLNQLLQEHEKLLQTTEIKLANKIVDLLQKREKLKNEKTTTHGIKAKIKNSFLSFKVGIKNFQLYFKSREYETRGHLNRVAKRYSRATQATTKPYEGWYKYQIPKINLRIVEKELLPLNEVAKKLGTDEESIRGLKNQFSIYHVRGQELVKRSELNEVLNRYPIKQQV